MQWGCSHSLVQGYNTTLIESSNRSVLKISYLENYIFLTNKIFNTKYMNKLISLLMFVPEMTFSITLSNRF